MNTTIASLAIREALEKCIWDAAAASARMNGRVAFTDDDFNAAHDVFAGLLQSSRLRPYLKGGRPPWLRCTPTYPAGVKPDEFY